jgi:hypothetical protein
LFPFRILVAALLLLTLGSITHWRTSRVQRMFLVLGVLWTVWSAFSLLWAPDLDRGLEQTVGIGFGLVVAVVMFNLGLQRDTHLDALFEGWMMAYTLAAAFAVRELLTGVYLPGALTDFYSPNEIRGVAISFFGNPNDYGAFILLSVPFILMGFHRARTRLIRRTAVVLLASVPVFAFLTTSRLALIGTFFMFAVFAMIGLETPRQRFRYMAAAAAVIVLIGSLFWSNSQTASEVDLLIGRDFALTGSDTARWHLTLNGLWMTLETRGMGVGAAGYAVVTATEYVPYSVGDIVDPHNFWIEVLAQHGVFVFAALMAWFIRVGRDATTTRRLRADRKTVFMHDTSVAILVGLAGYVIASVANSSFISQSSNWVFLASLAALAANLDQEGQVVSRWLEDVGPRRSGAGATFRRPARPPAGEPDPE